MENLTTLQFKKNIPDGIWVKCPECNEIIYNGELDRNLRICPKCDYYFPLAPADRINLIIDEGSFISLSGEENYDHVIMAGKALMSGHQIMIMVLNLDFESMTVSLCVCEKIINAIIQAADQKLPFLSICTNSDKISVRTGLFFPAQVLGISTAIGRLNAEKLAYISVISQSNSYSSFPGFVYISDVIIAEANILGTSHTGSRIGRREAERATQSLFQNSMVDVIVSRREIKQNLTSILDFLC